MKVRTLSSSLQAAQKSVSGRPYVKVEVLDKVAAVSRPKMSRLYTGTEADFHHDTTMPGDGSLIRVRLYTSDSHIYIQRVVNPSPTSDYSSWTQMDLAHTGANIVLCSRGSTVHLFFVDPVDDKGLYYRTSTDNGATWGSAVKILTPAITETKWLAADIAPDGDIVLFHVSDSHRVYVTRKTTSWSTPVSWSNSVSTLTGICSVYQGDWNVVVSGTDSSSDYKVWTCIYGDGTAQTVDTWSSLMELTIASSGSNVEFHEPHITFADVYRLFFVEKFTDTVSYNRPNWSHSLANATFADNLWREPVPFNLSTDYGVALTQDANYLWLSITKGVWRGYLSQPAVDLSQDLISLTLEDKLEGGTAILSPNPPREGVWLAS